MAGLYSFHAGKTISCTLNGAPTGAPGANYYFYAMVDINSQIYVRSVYSGYGSTFDSGWRQGTYIAENAWGQVSASIISGLTGQRTWSNGEVSQSFACGASWP